MTAAPRFASITIDDSRRPLLLVRMVGAYGEPEFRAYLDQMTRQLDWREKTVVIIDSRGAGQPNASCRKLQADWMAAHEMQLREYTIGLAMVMSQPMHRAVLTAILWVRPLPCPHAIVSTMMEALEWARMRFREENVPFAFEGALV